MAKEFFEKIFKHDKVSAFPKDFEDSLILLKNTRQCTLDVVAALEKVLKSEKKEKKKEKQSIIEHDEIGSLARTCEKYQNTFGDGSLTTVLTSTSTAFTIVAKKDRYCRKESIEQVLNPLKVWAEDDYPKFMKDIKKCQELHDKMESAGKAVQSKPTPERTKKYENFKIEFHASYERCKNELDRVKKVNTHHMNCIKLLGQHYTTFYNAIDDELGKAQDAIIRTVSSVEKSTPLKDQNPAPTEKK